MPASEAHQLYCTHCTYGTSALHRHEGEIRDQVFEYSTRSGSVAQAECHDVFRQVEPCLYFHLPPDTPPQDVRSLTADTCPWQRMIYYPAISGLQMLSRVCYRQTDTRGRPGSYFAHVLLEKQSDSRSSWSAAECLKLWGARFWVSEDSPQLPFDLERPPVLSKSDGPAAPNGPTPLSKLDGYESLINDNVLMSFLTTPSQGPFTDQPEDSKNCVIPLRWRKLPAADRKQLLVDLLRGFLELDWERQERLVIAIEPSLAALVFYGILRCLPQKGLVGKASFSTYEAHIDRPSTTLVACTFFRPEVEELLPETYRSKGYVRNTYKNHPPRPFRNPDGRFAEWIVSRLVRDGVAGVETVIRDLEAAGAATPADWEHVVMRHEQCEAVCAGKPVADFGNVPLPDVQRLYVGRVLGRLLEKAPRERMQSLAAGPAYLSLLDFTGAHPKFSPCEKATVALLAFLPRSDGVRHRFLKLPHLATTFKARWLASSFKKNGSLPTQVLALWEPDALKSKGLLSQLVDRLDAQEVGRAADHVPDRHLPQFVGLVAESAARDPKKSDALVELLKQLQPDAVVSLLATQSGVILRYFPPPQPQLAARLEQLLKDLSRDVSFFHVRLNALNAGKGYVTQAAVKNQIQAWDQFREAIKSLVKFTAPTNGAVAGQPLTLEAAQDHLLDSMARVFSDRPRPPASGITLQFLKGVMVPLAGVQAGTIWESAGRPLLARQAQLMDDADFVQLLSGESADVWLKEYPPEYPILADRLRSILDNIPAQGAQLASCVTILTIACERQLLDKERPRVEAWAKAAQILEALKSRLRQEPKMLNMLPNVPQDVGPMLGDLAEELAKAMLGQVWVSRKTDAIENWHLVSALGQGVFDNLFLDEATVFRKHLRYRLTKG